MATNIFSSLSAQFRSRNLPLPKVPSALRNPTLTTATLTAAIAIGIISLPALIARAARSYRGYLALGPGGMPHNVLGWTIQGLLQPFAWRDTRDPARTVADPARQGPYEPHGRRTFLVGEEGGGGGGSPAPAPRRGDRPVVPAYVAPQRQMTQQGSGETRARMLAYLEGLAALNAGLLAQKGSGLEGAGTPALWLDGGGGGGGGGGEERGVVVLPPYLRSFGGELVHVHPEASSHITVSPADAEALVRGGWAESHRLSGVWNVVPLSYVLVYAPRDEAELEFWKGVVRAGVRFVCAGLEREAVFE
ncbi:hypothetical protein VPNG_05385 [Cytospora leucostoma]|uniref:Luciferase domain-containing protein n=1 Tax=Cytospora leucostoma TaxID=1230097 RepID=A0A423X4Q9_9PEZI|nr:hypothetical protein VPNG_05385 [Cytospora leucostoma]